MNYSLKWSNGTVLEQSPRITPSLKYPSHAEENQMQTQSQSQKPGQVPATLESILNENKAYIHSLEEEGFREANKREETWEKIASRDLVAQIGVNPFMNSNTPHENYVRDIAIRDQFMKPINTSEEKAVDTSPGQN